MTYFKDAIPRGTIIVADKEKSPAEIKQMILAWMTTHSKSSAV